jgi:hypothetical protein
MVKKTYTEKSTKTSKIHPEFTEPRLTNWSGLVPFGDFLLETLDFRRAVGEQVDFGMAPNVSYQNWQVFGLMIFGNLCGQAHYNHFEELSKDKVVQRLLGLDSKIDENTLAERLKRAGQHQSVQVDRVTGQLARQVHKQSKNTKRGPAWIDFDSTVKSVYGDQQGAEKGFNPHKKGQKSYHPLLAFLASNKECLHSKWRPGSAYTANGAAEFFAEAFRRLPAHHCRYAVRADSGFFGDGFLSAIEQANCDYLVKVKLKNLKPLLAGQNWQDIPGSEDYYCEFSHQCEGWKHPRKFVAVRTLKKTLTDGELFPQHIYSYSCYVTNFKEAPLMLHHWYGDRGECENWIEAVKNQLYAGTTLVNHFWANALSWQLSVLAYNLSIWLRWLTDRQAWRAEPATFREWFIHCAGKLVYHARRWVLKMQESYWYASRWKKIYEQLCCLQL